MIGPTRNWKGRVPHSSGVIRNNEPRTDETGESNGWARSPHRLPHPVRPRQCRKVVPPLQPSSVSGELFSSAGAVQ